MKYHKLIAGETTGTFVMESPVTEADILQMAGDSTRTWTPIPRTLGQRLHADLDTHSTATWTLIPQALGQ